MLCALAAGRILNPEPHTFWGHASGHRLNPGKTKLLPLSAVPAHLPADAHSLTVARGLPVALSSN